jgi:hypothetical protein
MAAAIGEEFMRSFHLRSWSGFEEVLRKVELERHSTKSGRLLMEPLFRGFGNSKWRLEMTLERSYPAECRTS